MIKKVIIWLLLAITSLTLILAVLFYLKLNLEKLEIDFLNVGQGDASLIKLPNNKVILIDGGPDNLVLKRLGENLPFYQRRIDLIILSHFHDDHILGLIEVISRYRVGTIIYMKDGSSSKLLELFLTKAKQKNIKLTALVDEAEITYFPSCLIKVFNPLVLGVKNDNNNSLITKLNCRSLSALFTGDNNEKVENTLLKTKLDLTAKIFKASHHGSKSANSEIFLRAVNPLFFVISVGAQNRFGHPSQEILERINALGIKTKRTDQDGTVVISGFISD